MGDYDTTIPEENSVLRADSIKSSSLLQLSDIITQNILLHPFIALRRTCQVNRKCSPFICVQPFSLIPFLYHQQRKQGIAALYRGLSSELLVKGITLGAETAIISYTDWPREVSQKRLLQDSVRVLALRGLSVAISTPFLCAAVKETIQSVIVVRDRPSFVDCVKDGFLRLIHLRSIPSARMLPIWLLVVPTVLYHVSHSIIWQVTTRCLEALRSNTLFGPSSRRSGRRANRNYMKSSRSVMHEESRWQQDELTYDAN
jgi:solute carrier family 25 protein 46